MSQEYKVKLEIFEGPLDLLLYLVKKDEVDIYEISLERITQQYLQARGTWIRMTWNDRAKQLSLEPGAPPGATNLATRRTFRVLVLPAGTTKDVSYEGKRVAIRF